MNQKIKIIIGINDFLVGGAQKLIVDQLKNFNLDRFDITVVTLFSFPGRKNFYDLIPSFVAQKHFNFKSFLNIRAWWELSMFLKSEKPDIIISHLFASNTIFRVLKTFNSIPVITVEHNTYIYKKWYEVLFDRILAPLSDSIIAVSDAVRDFAALQAGVDPKKIAVVPNGIDLVNIENFLTNFDKESFKKELGFHDKRILLNVGRLTTQKNQELLIRGFDHFSRNHPEYVLLIAGEGFLKEKLENLVKELGLGKQVFLLGARSDVLKFFAASDFLVSTSIIEGMSVAYLEALACGLPIVATRTAGTTDIVKENINGFFFPSLSEGEVAEVLSRLPEADRHFLSHNAKESSKTFDIAKNVVLYESEISSLIRPTDSATR